MSNRGTKRMRSEEDETDALSKAVSERLKLEDTRQNTLRELIAEQESVNTVTREVQALSGTATSVQEDSDQAQQNKTAELLLIQNEEEQIKIRVGDTVFTTTKATLCKDENMFKVMMNTAIPLDRDENGAITVEEGRKPELFAIILDHLRSGKLLSIGIPEDNLEQLEELLEESDYYGCRRLSAYLKTLIEIRQDELNPKEILVPEIAKKAPTMLFKKRLDEDDDEPLLDELEQEKEPQKPRKESEPFDEKEWITEFEKMTLNQEEKLQQYYSSKKQELQQEKERLNAEKQKLLNERKGTDKVVLNVGGREFHVSVSNFASHKECILNQIFLLGVQDGFFIDRDPDLFEIVHEYLKTSSTEKLPTDRIKRRQLREEALFYNVAELIAFYDPLRYPLESIGQEYIQMKEREDRYRSLFATDRSNPILDDPLLDMIPVFAVRDTFVSEFPPADIPLLFNFDNAPKLLPSQNRWHTRYERRRLLASMENQERPNQPHLTRDLETFRKQWRVFTSGLFEGMDCSNIFFAGGSVLAATMQVDENHPALQREQKAQLSSDEAKRMLGLVKTENSIDDIQEDDFEFADEEIQDEEEQPQENVFPDESVELAQYMSQDPGNRIREIITRNTAPLGYNLYGANVQQISEESHDTKLGLYYEQSTFSSSDIDIFLYALTEQEAEQKVRYIYETVKENLVHAGEPSNRIAGYGLGRRYGYGQNPSRNENEGILVMRTKHAITFHFAYPIRPIQIILRIYKSPAEVLMGFDVDSCCVGYDGKQVYCLPRARRAINTRMNLVDVDRQSTTYEVRLFKYAKRGFRVGVPGYDPELIQNEEVNRSQAYESIVAAVTPLVSPDIIDPRRVAYPGRDRSHFKERQGLSRLLLFERAIKQPERHAYRTIGLSGWRPKNILDRFESQVRDLDPQLERVKKINAYKKFVEKEANRPNQPFYYRRRNYQPREEHDYTQIFIPWCRGWTPNYIKRRIETMREYQVEKSKKQVFTYALNDIDSILFADDDRSEIHGSIKWLTVNPGTQMVGSFNPVETNFYQDAYTRTKAQREIIAKAREVLRKAKTPKAPTVTVTWSWDSGNGYTPYTPQESATIEKAYRQYVASNAAQHKTVIVSDTHEIDFEKRKQVNRKDHKRTRGIKRDVTGNRNVSQWPVPHTLTQQFPLGITGIRRPTVPFGGLHGGFGLGGGVPAMAPFAPGPLAFGGGLGMLGMAGMMGGGAGLMGLGGGMPAIPTFASQPALIPHGTWTFDENNKFNTAVELYSEEDYQDVLERAQLISAYIGTKDVAQVMDKLDASEDDEIIDVDAEEY